MVGGDEQTNTSEPLVNTDEAAAIVNEGANSIESSVMWSVSADYDQDDQQADRDRDNQTADCQQGDQLINCDQDEQQADCDQDQSANKCDQVNTTVDYRTASSMVDNDRFDQGLTHNDGTSSDHEDIPTVHMDMPTEHETCNRRVNNDTPPCVTDHPIQEDHVTEETLHNSVDQLFHDFSVDELFEDV